MSPSETTNLWLRCEKKKFEHRAALTPTTARALLDDPDHKFKISVEHDPERIFKDEEYEKVGCTLVEHNSWNKAPAGTLIIGLKELPVSTEPISHTHIQFAHCYKRQGGWVDVLRRFSDGKGTLYDLEFLTDEQKRRVAAFGYHAGFAGSAAGALAFASRKKGKVLGSLEPYENQDAMIKHVHDELVGDSEKEVTIKVLAMGALGRCGSGAVGLFQQVLDRNKEMGNKKLNIEILKWDLEETKKGGPFQEILDVDIFVNCIYLSHKIPHFVNHETINAAGRDRRLSVVVDVSCDTTNPFNPIPIYTVNTTFDSPTVDVEVGPGNPPMSVISIDHLPTLLPREASEQFSHDLLPSLRQLPNRSEARVWVDAETLFREKLAEAQLV